MSDTTELSKSEEIDLLRDFVIRLPLQSYLRSVFCANGLAADIEKAIAQDYGFIQRTPESIEKEWREADKALKAVVAYHESLQTRIAAAHAKLKGIIEKFNRIREQADLASSAAERIREQADLASSAAERVVHDAEATL